MDQRRNGGHRASGTGRRRLDQIAARLFSGLLQVAPAKLDRAGDLRADGKLSAQDKVTAGARSSSRPIRWRKSAGEPQPMALDISSTRNDSIIVLDKPAGLVGASGSRTRRRPLVNALLDHAPELACVPRGGNSPSPR